MAMNCPLLELPADHRVASSRSAWQSSAASCASRGEDSLLDTADARPTTRTASAAVRCSIRWSRRAFVNVALGSLWTSASPKRQIFVGSKGRVTITTDQPQ